MRKTLNDLASYIKGIIPSKPTDIFEVKERFKDVSNELEIKEGINAYIDFLKSIYDILIIKGELYDNNKKVVHEYENRITLSVYYPFLDNIKSILMNIGYYGIINDQIIISKNRFFNEKISISKNLECLIFLVDCGLKIEGIDLTNKIQNLSNLNEIKISYPSNPKMLIGLKCMSIAEKEFGTLDNQDIFLRCDYKVLKNSETDIICVLNDLIRPLSQDMQNYILHLHQNFIDNGLNYSIEIKGFWIFIKYSYKRKELWGFNASLNNGIHINVKVENMDKHINIVQNFPAYLQELLKKGYGCGRKRNGFCDGGCRGLQILLEDSILNIKKDIEMWFNQEINFLKNK